MRTTLTPVVFVAFFLVFASLQSNAIRPTLKEHHRKLTNDRLATTAVPTAGVGVKDTTNVVPTDQSKGSGDTEKNTGGSSSSTEPKNDDVNPTYRQYGAGSNPDSSTDTHRYYSVADHQGSSSNDDGHKSKH